MTTSIAADEISYADLYARWERHPRVAADGAPTAVYAGRAEHPDLTLHCRFADWVDITAGRTAPRRALLQGKVRPTGRLRTLIRAPRLFA